MCCQSPWAFNIPNKWLIEMGSQHTQKKERVSLPPKQKHLKHHIQLHNFRNNVTSL